MTGLCTLSMREIVDITAQAFEMSAVDLVSPRRDARTVRARNAAAWLMRELLPRSYPQIGRALGGRDHTTIMHACAAAEADMAAHPDYAAKVSSIRDFCVPARSLDAPDSDPFEVASRILRSPREATGVSLETIRDFAAIAVAALQEATQQEAARAREIISRAEEAGATNAGVEQLRIALAEANSKIETLENAANTANAPQALARQLREWTDATIAAETASGPGQRAANTRVEKAGIALLLAAETHFNIQRKFK